MKTRLSFLLILIVSAQINFAQDKVILKDGSIQTIKISERTAHKIKYKASNYPDGPTYVLPLTRIKEIRYGNGDHDPLYSNNPRMNRPFNLGASIALTTDNATVLPLFKCGYFIHPNIELEFDAVTDFYTGLYAGIGGKFHAFSNSNNNVLTPFVGLKIGHDGEFIYQIPIGLNYAGKKGFNYLFSITPMYYLLESLTQKTPAIYETLLEFGISYRL